MDIERDLTPTQKFLLGDELSKVKGELEAVVVKEKVAAKEKITLSNNLNKMFPSVR